ncbi:hypothetical protein CkaCkLH20_11186 [Colletotrichum karsti]|uniref:Uncharacterized protein n=1 Tax=Colletotrichum karsti TaxID=1095194 RepID=A0A9P6HW80_9PEZI|nr:uncharacterized protein CkaCkLH20_11186 [Colletotrichum karsti]KAF9871265.1 hypothetical protein CkaCkLH20_11186 [Colletotrichum karsti]
MALTLTTGFTDSYEQVTELASEDQNQFYSDYLTYIRLLFDKTGTSPETFDALDIALCDGDATRFRVAASPRRDRATSGAFSRRRESADETIRDGFGDEEVFVLV